MSSDSVSEWLTNLKRGDPAASEKVWERYFRKLVAHARNRPGRGNLAAGDAEDISAEAFAGFYQAVEAGRFAKLNDRDDLWQILLMLTERRTVDKLRREHAAKRSGNRDHAQPIQAGDVALEGKDARGMSRIIDNEPTPGFAAEAAEGLDRLLDALPNDALKRIALEKLHGYTNREIADRLDTSLRSIERRLGLIRLIWTERGMA